MTIVFDVGSDKRQSSGLRRVVGAFSDLVAEVESTGDRAEKDGPWIAGPFAGGRRAKASAMPRAWVALDLDKIGDEIVMLRIMEAAEAWRGFGYTTASHCAQAGVFKVRLIFEADRDVTPAEYPRLCAGLAQCLAQLAQAPVERDTACDKIEQPIFTLRAGATTWHFDGAPIVVDELLSNATEEPQASDGERPRGGMQDWLDQLLSGDDLHPAALRIVGNMVARGLTRATIKAWFAGVAQRVAIARGIDRAQELTGTELDRMIAGALRKGYAPPPIPEIEDEQPQAGDGEQPSEPKPERVSPAPMDSDIWLSALFAKRNTGFLRWSPGLDWLRNDGPRWVPDDTAVRLTRAKSMLAQMSCRANIDPERRRSVASAKTVGAVITLARVEPGIVTPAETWDRDPMVLNTPGGPFDLRTGKRLAAFTDLFTQIAGAAPDPAMRTPTWLRFTSEIFGNDLEMVEFLQRLMGYCLTGDRSEQILPFFHGVGANGKSVLVDEMMALAGTYALKLPAEALMRQRHQAHPTELAQLRGKRLAISSELEDGAHWAEARIKELTGDATLTARFMRQDHFTFAQTQKHIVVANFKPRLKGDDPAMARRMLLVPFAEVFEGPRRDPMLSAKLAAERPGILAWAIEGAAKWARDGLRTPERVRRASADYMGAHDDIALWLEDCCAVGAQYRCSNASLYASFSAWKQSAGEHPPSNKAWSERMLRRFQPYRTMRERGFVGVAPVVQMAGNYARASNGD